MPDITLCSTSECPRRTECYRAQAKPSYMQSYMTFEAEDCGYFWPFRVPVERIETIELEGLE